MKLFILRHGLAETFAASDADRELAEAGRNEVRQVIRVSAEDLSALDKLWVSPLRRAQQTADIATQVLGPVSRETSDLLLPESNASDVLAMLAAQENASVLLVSHQPLVGELVNGLCGKDSNYFPMGTAALACIDLGYPAMGCGELVWIR